MKKRKISPHIICGAAAGIIGTAAGMMMLFSIKNMIDSGNSDEITEFLIFGILSILSICFGIWEIFRVLNHSEGSPDGTAPHGDDDNGGTDE